MKRPKLSKGLIFVDAAIPSLFPEGELTSFPVILSAKMDKKRKYNQNCKADILR